MRSHFLLALLNLGSALVAQTTMVGWRDDVFPNTSGAGTLNLACRVYYPSTVLGAGMPLKAQVGGYPVILHLHGAGGHGRATPEYSAAIAAGGYILVMQDTASSSSSTQYSDAMATITALQAENTKSTSFYKGQLDMTRFGVIGHSMGGGNTLRVLAASTVPKLGVTFASTNGTSSAPNVKVPVLLVVGQGDTVVSPSTSLNNYNSLTNYTGSKALFQFNNECNHATMLATPLNQVQADIFTRTMKVTVGFLNTHLRGETAGYEEVAGQAARAEPRLTQLYTGYERPLTWYTWLQNGLFTARVATACEPGPSFLMASLQQVAIQTPYGILGLDPATLVVLPGTMPTTKLMTFDITLPAELLIGGLALPFQAIGANRAVQQKLSNVVATRID